MSATTPQPASQSSDCATWHQVQSSQCEETASQPSAQDDVRQLLHRFDRAEISEELLHQKILTLNPGVQEFIEIFRWAQIPGNFLVDRTPSTLREPETI